MGILSTLPGFRRILSPLGALEIDDITRFPTKAKFASYCGLIPSTFASGEKVYHGDLIPTVTAGYDTASSRHHGKRFAPHQSTLDATLRESSAIKAPMSPLLN